MPPRTKKPPAPKHPMIRVEERDWTDDQVARFADLTFDGVHPIRIARAMGLPVREVHDRWKKLMDDLEDEELPGFVQEWRERRHANAG